MLIVFAARRTPLNRALPWSVLILFVNGLFRSLRRAKMEEKIEGDMRLLQCSSNVPVEVSQSKTFWRKAHVAL